MSDESGGTAKGAMGAFKVDYYPLDRGKNPSQHTADLLIKSQADVVATDAQIAYYHRVRQMEAAMRRIIFPDGAGCKRPRLMKLEEWNRRRDCHNDYVKWLVDVARPGLEYATPQVALAERGLDVVCWDIVTRFGRSTRTRVLAAYAAALACYLLGAFSLMLVINYGIDHYKDELTGAREILLVSTQRLLTYGMGLLGAAVGAWLIRTQRALTDDWPTLVATASDPVRSWIRAAYVLLFAAAAILMLRAGVVTFEVAGLLNSETAFPRQVLPGDRPSLPGALLIGLLFGLADLTLPNSISERASDVVRRFAVVTAAPG